MTPAIIISAELIPLAAATEGHHDAFGTSVGGIWFPSPSLKPQEGYKNEPVVWRLKWPEFIVDKLVSSDNPNGSIPNSDLGLVGGLLHLEALAQCFDTQERTVLSKTDNLNVLFWQRKASSSSDKPAQWSTGPRMAPWPHPPPHSACGPQFSHVVLYS